MKSFRPHLYFLLYILMVIPYGCRPQEERTKVEGRVVLLDSINAPVVDYQIDSLIDLYRKDLEEEMNQVVVQSAVAMTKASPEGLLNNFVADLVFEQARERYPAENNDSIDFCLLNYGGLRTSIPEGPVTRSRVFELMPFENEMVVITLTPEKTWELFEYLARSSQGMPVSGIRLGMREQVVEQVSIQGAPFDASRNYKILTSDYLASGGDNMTFFLEPLDTEFIGMKIRDAILLHMQRQNEAGKKIDSQLDGRIYSID